MIVLGKLDDLGVGVERVLAVFRFPVFRLFLLGQVPLELIRCAPPAIGDAASDEGQNDTVIPSLCSEASVVLTQLHDEHVGGLFPLERDALDDVVDVRFAAITRSEKGRVERDADDALGLTLARGLGLDFDFLDRKGDHAIGIEKNSGEGRCMAGSNLHFRKVVAEDQQPIAGTISNSLCRERRENFGKKIERHEPLPADEARW